MSEKVSMMKGMTGHGAYMLIRMTAGTPDEIEELMQAWLAANTPPAPEPSEKQKELLTAMHCVRESIRFAQESPPADGHMQMMHTPESVIEFLDRVIGGDAANEIVFDETPAQSTHP